MKFYLVFTITYNDGTKDGVSIYTYDNVNEALANFHKQLGGWMLKENAEHLLAVVVNSQGGIHANEVFDRGTVVEEPIVDDGTDVEETE